MPTNAHAHDAKSWEKVVYWVAQLPFYDVTGHFQTSEGRFMTIKAKQFVHLFSSPATPIIFSKAVHGVLPFYDVTMRLQRADLLRITIKAKQIVT